MKAKKQRSNIQWAFAEAIRTCDCPTCEAPAGAQCDENDRDIPHLTRVEAYREYCGDEDFRLRHGRLTREERRRTR